MEIIVSLFIIMVIMVGIYSLIVLALKLANNNKHYVEAIEIANQRMERIRNMPYTEIGVVSGMPNGTIPAVETIYREGTFTVNTYITFYDDPYDGSAGSSTKPDTIPNDYKIATIKVGWQSSSNFQSITVFSKIIPRTEETAAGFGLLKIFVVNSNGQPVPGASVRVINAASSTDVTNLADSEGVLYLVAPAAFQGYEVIASNTGYSTDKTYAVTALNPNPTKKNLSVTEGDKTEESFTIDRMSTLNIRTVSASALPANWRVNRPIASSTNSSPRLSFDGANSLYAAWKNVTSTTSMAYVQKYDAAGNRQWADDVSISSTHFQDHPDIATSKAGVSYVVWQDNSKAIKSLAVGFPSTGLMRQLAQNPILPIGHPEFGLSDNFETFNSSLLSLQPSGNNLPKKTALLRSILKVEQAEAAGSIVQAKIGAAVDSAGTMTATFNAAPIPGNTIIAIAVLRDNATTFNVPTNTKGAFTAAVYSDSAWSLDTGIWYKAIGAGEPQTVTITANNDIGGGELMILEVSGLDNADPLYLTAKNDQTGSSAMAADTGTTAASKNTGFAIAASAFADNDFDVPTSARWSSVSSNNWSQALWDDWNTGNDGSLAVATMDITAVSAQKGTLTLTGGGTEERNSVIAIFNTTIPNNLTVTSAGTQAATVFSPGSDKYIGGTFVLSNAGPSLNVQAITVSENGSVNGLTDLSNIRLFYDLDTTLPYDCSGESFNIATDPAFGIASSSFSSADGVASFSSGLGIAISGTKTMCVYAVMDIGSSAPKNSSIDIEISNPSSQIKTSSGTIVPSTPVLLSGSTIIQKPAEFNQAHYRFRRDDGDEASATWNTFEDSASTLVYGENIRLRFEIANSGNLDDPSAQFRLEYAVKSGFCSLSAGWTAVPTDDSAHWKVVNSSNLNDRDPSTNMLSGLTDEAAAFIPGQVKDAGNQTDALTLVSDTFTEIEYSISQTNNATDDTYCFRLTNAGSTADFAYASYPELNALGDDNVFIAALKSDGTALWGPKRINDDLGIYQGNPKIALSENDGYATATVAWEDSRNGNLDIYARTIASDGVKGAEFRVSDSGTPEHSPALAIDRSGNAFIAWVDDSATGQDIYLEKFSQTGAKIWAIPVSVAATIADEYNASISIGDNGELLIAWEENDSGNKNIRLAKFDNNGVKIWEVSGNVSNTAADQSEPDVAASSSFAFLSWTDKREGNFDVYAQKYDTNGTALWTDDIKINMNPDASIQESPQLALIGSNEPYAVWEDSRDGDINIYATGFNDPSVPSAVPNIPLLVKGTKQIGENPVILKYTASSTTNALGQLPLSLEWDAGGYTVTIDPSLPSRHIITSDPIMPLGILAGTTTSLILYID